MPVFRATQPPEPEGELQAPAADIHCITIDPTEPAEPAGDNKRIIRNNMGFWANSIVLFCFGSPIPIAFLSVQPQTTPQGRPPITLHLVSLSILLAFTSIVVSKFIDSDKFASAVRLLEGAGVFFGFTAIFMAFTVPFPFHMKCITWTLYVSVLAVFVCNTLSA